MKKLYVLHRVDSRESDSGLRSWHESEVYREAYASKEEAKAAARTMPLFLWAIAEIEAPVV